MNIKKGIMLIAIVLVVSVATITIVSNPVIAVKPQHPHNHGACVSGQAKNPGLNMDLLIQDVPRLGHNSYLFISDIGD